jgi:integrase
MKLTKATVERLKLPPDKSEALWFDEGLPGFGLRMRAGGKRTWITQYRLGSQQRRVTLGSVETLDAAAARQRAKDVLSKVHLGADPQMEKAEARAQAATTLGSVVETYLARRAAPRLKASTLEDVQRYLKRHWAPLSKLPVGKITRANVAAQLSVIAEESGAFAANRARATLSALYSWAIGEGLTDTNPVVGTNKPADEIARDRVLSPVELSAIWRQSAGGDFGAIVRLLILTGQRREEVGGMLWSEIDTAGAVWRIGADRTKNSLAHDMPLSAPALAVLSGIPRRERRDLVFGEGVGAFSGWSKAKAALDGRVASALGRAPAPWRLHDIRRTVATRLADLGVQPHVIEAALNHISGHKAGVAGVYNRAAYAAEKRDALDLWAQRVERLTAP